MKNEVEPFPLYMVLIRIYSLVIFRNDSWWVPGYHRMRIFPMMLLRVCPIIEEHLYCIHLLFLFLLMGLLPVGCLKSQNLGSKTINFASINPIGDITFRVFSTSPDFQPEWMVLSEESLIKRINFEYIIPLSLGSCGFPDPNKARSILYSFVWLPKVHRQRFHKNTDPIREPRMFLSVALVTFLKH